MGCRAKAKDTWSHSGGESRTDSARLAVAMFEWGQKDPTMSLRLYGRRSRGGAGELSQQSTKCKSGTIVKGSNSFADVSTTGYEANACIVWLALM